MFEMDLCSHLSMTLRQLRLNLGPNEMKRWIAYSKVKPFGYDIENKRFGTIASAVINMAGKINKKTSNWTDIFKPSWKKIEEVKSPMQALEAFLRAGAEKNGTVIKKEK